MKSSLQLNHPYGRRCLLPQSGRCKSSDGLSQIRRIMTIFQRLLSATFLSVWLLATKARSDNNPHYIRGDPWWMGSSLFQYNEQILSGQNVTNTSFIFLATCGDSDLRVTSDSYGPRALSGISEVFEGIQTCIALGQKACLDKCSSAFFVDNVTETLPGVDEGTIATKARAHILSVHKGQNTADFQEFLRSTLKDPDSLRLAGGYNRTLLRLIADQEEVERLKHRSEVDFVVDQPPLFFLSPRLVLHLSNAPQKSNMPGLRAAFYKDSTPLEREETLTRMNELMSQTFGMKEFFHFAPSGLSTPALQTNATTHVGLFVRALDLLLKCQKLEEVQLNEGLRKEVSTAQLFPASGTQEDEDFTTSAAEFSTHHRRLDVWTKDILDLTPIYDMGIDGTGVLAGVIDSGLYMYHDQFAQDTIPLNVFNASERKVAEYVVFADDKDNSEAIDGRCGHGTHVAGLLAGSSRTGLSMDIGVAPGAKLAIADIYKVPEVGRPFVIYPPAFHDLLSSEGFQKAHILSVSYNLDLFGLPMVDDYLLKHPQTLLVAAAGNSGRGIRENICPSSAKNALAVGSSKNHASLKRLFETGGQFYLPKSKYSHGKHHRLYNDGKGASTFSQQGPSIEGRRKPDVLCPGSILSSAMSLDLASHLSQVPTSGRCSLEGTSMAAPVCAGVAALFLQWLHEGRYGNGRQNESLAYASPPSSLLKALMIHSAEDAGYETNFWEGHRNSVRGDHVQGFGIVTPHNIIRPADGPQVFFVPKPLPSSREPSLSQGQTHIFEFNEKGFGDAKGVLRATLVWTDQTAAFHLHNVSPLVNDLDLRVLKVYTDSQGQRNRSELYSPIGVKNGDRDRKNNVEVVDVPHNPESDSEEGLLYVVEVTAARIEVGPAQNYSLVVSFVDCPYVDLSEKSYMDLRGNSGAWLSASVVTVLITLPAFLAMLL